MKRWMYFLIPVALIGIGIFAWRILAASARTRALAEMETATVTRGSLTASVGATGIVRANQAVMLGFQTSGTVGQVLVEAGDTVSAGALLAGLLQTSLSSQQILAQVDLVNAQRALDELLNSDSARRQAQLALAQAEQALDRAEHRWQSQPRGQVATEETQRDTEERLAEAEDELAAAQLAYDAVANLPQGDPARAQAQADLISAHQEYIYVRYLLAWYNGAPGTLAQAVLDAELEVARANLSDAQREWERVKDGPNPEDVAAAQARVDAAQAILNTKQISAPFAGTITLVSVTPGDQAAPGQPAFGLSDLSRLLVEVDLSEIDINRVTLGQEAELVFDAVPQRTYRGTVVDVALTGDVNQGVVSFKVTVELVDPDDSVKPGMTAAVSIIVEQIDNVLLVPNRAIKLEDGQHVVYVLRGGVPQAVAVALGASSDLYSEVRSADLQEGDIVALNVPSSLFTTGHPEFFGRTP